MMMGPDGQPMPGAPGMMMGPAGPPMQMEMIGPDGQPVPMMMGPGGMPVPIGPDGRPMPMMMGPGWTLGAHTNGARRPSYSDASGYVWAGCSADAWSARNDDGP